MKNIVYKNGKVYILDQTKLPNEEIYLEMHTKEDFFEAIKKLQVRGAPAIGIAAAYAMAVIDGDKAALKAHLDSARPTAVNLSWATGRMLDAYQAGKNLIDEAKAIQAEDEAMCLQISEHGLSLLHDHDGILTHCNAGALATSAYGTGLGPLLLGTERGYRFKIYSDETRPLLQGARLTSYELQKAGADVTLICDSAAGLLMKQGKINAVLVGADRIAANGDTANKIGTSSVAVLAHYYHIPFYVLAPYSTIDFACPSGDKIIIEERAPEEIKQMYFEKPTALPETKCFNPAFDVTDNALITAIITEKGVVRAPFSKNLRRLYD